MYVSIWACGIFFCRSWTFLKTNILLATFRVYQKLWDRPPLSLPLPRNYYQGNSSELALETADHNQNLKQIIFEKEIPVKVSDPGRMVLCLRGRFICPTEQRASRWLWTYWAEHRYFHSWSKVWPDDYMRREAIRSSLTYCSGGLEIGSAVHASFLLQHGITPVSIKNTPH